MFESTPAGQPLDPQDPSSKTTSYTNSRSSQAFLTLEHHSSHFDSCNLSRPPKNPDPFSYCNVQMTSHCTDLNILFVNLGAAREVFTSF